MIAPAAASAAAPALEQTIRIEHDRRRLLMRVLASIVALLATCSALVISILRADTPAFRLEHARQLDAALRPYISAMPWWTCTLLAIAVVCALAGTLRNVFRLQDGDPALVISPRGISFRPAVLAEVVRIPWTAIRGLRLRQRKQNRFLAVHVEEPDRYAAQARMFGNFPRLFRVGVRANEIDLASPMSKQAWTETEALLQRYLARYGKPAAPGESARAAARNDADAPRLATSPRARD